jgi:hypothetical protein
VRFCGLLFFQALGTAGTAIIWLEEFTNILCYNKIINGSGFTGHNQEPVLI